MTKHTNNSPRPSIFAQKGEATPAPAVAYVSLRQMQGFPERRDDVLDRRAQWGDRQADANTTEDHTPQRRAAKSIGADHDGRRHYTPLSGLAMGQQYVPWSQTEKEAETPKKSARARQGSPSVASLSALIHRHKDGAAQAAPREPASQNVATTEPPLSPSPVDKSAGPTKVDMSYLSAAASQGARTTVAKSPPAPQAEQPPAAYKKKIIRKKVTFRLEIEQYKQMKILSDRDGQSQQSVIAAAMADYLNKNI